MNTPKKKLYQKPWFKITGITFSVIFIALLGVDIYFRTLAIPECESGEAKIKCPFLAISKPSMESRAAFVNDVEKFGMDRTMATFVAIQVGWQQKGLWAIIKGKAPDIYALDQVHGVTHCDLFSKFIPELEEMVKAKEIDGQITLQDLVEMKKWVAQQVQVEISEPSKIETSLLFVKAGGNLETQKVYTEDVFMLLRGIKPKRDAPINVTLLNKSKALAKWN
ncbi:MAG TPA: hypothetical protein PKE17_12230 [Saprospiraceae bacterium]|nr:hypothetical protein [Saprospiraceae bacterium]